MKRILSVILSLALLASVLIIPMSVNADNSVLDADTAFENLNAAVDGLVTDWDNVTPSAFATPIYSISKYADSAANRTRTADAKYVEIADSTDSKLGPKTFKIKQSFPVLSSGQGGPLVAGAVNAIEYTGSLSPNCAAAKNIGALVFYVKTNRSFTMSFGTHNGYTYGGVFKQNIQVEAKEGYQPVVIDFLKELDWTSLQRLLSSSKSLFGNGVFASIVSMTDGKGNTIGEGDDITFGSLLYVPIDTNVRDFKYYLDETNTQVNPMYASLTVNAVLAAEKINNDDSRYTEESFAALQNAIKDAKATLIADSSKGEANAIALFKGEAAELYTLEEVFRPKYIDDANDAQQASTEYDPSTLALDATQKANFGDYTIKADANTKSVHFVPANATSRYPSGDAYKKIYKDYDSLYLTYYNTKTSLKCTSNALINGFAASINLSNNMGGDPGQFGLSLGSGYQRVNLYKLNLAHDWNYNITVLSYSAEKIDNNELSYDGATRYQIVLGTSEKEIYFGSIIGEKPINVSDIDNVTSKATLIKYYAEKIANNGYANAAAVEETMELLGITTVQVVKELNNTIGIEYPENHEYTLETAVVGENVSFSLTNIPTGAIVTVKYGEDIVNPVDDVYTITVEKGKELHIIPSHVTTTFMYADTSNYTADINTNLNLAKGITPYMFVTKDNQRTLKTGSTASFSDGNVDAGYEPNPGFKFADSSNNFINGYKPYDSSDSSTVFNFKRKASEYDAFVDVIYDLGRVADINKVQHFGHKSADLNLGAYSVYASTNVNNLFNRNESLVVDYQNKTVANSQQHEFPTRSARFVAFRIYCPVTTSGRADVSNQLRIKELAIYGTPTNDIDYKVTEIQAPTSSADVEDGDLLNANTFESVKAYDDGEFKGADIWDSETNLGKLNSGTYSEGVHANISCGVVYYKDGKCKNGYSFDRSNLNGNIVFNVPTKPKTYYDFTYDLGDYYAVDRVDMYTSSLTDRRVQAYEVYIGNDLETLYTGKPVVVYNNYYNIYGQKITFDKAKIGKYVGYRVLNPGTATDNDTYPRISELAAYGDKVTSAADATLKPKDGLSSESVFLWNKDNSSVYTGDDDVTEYTAARLSVKYQSPLGENGLADTSKICLANGKSANIVERNVIAIAKTKYNAETGLDITTAGAKHSTATGEALNKCWKTNGQNVYAVFKLNNIKSTQKDYEFVVTGRIVYEYNGTYYTEYSPVFGADQDISAQSVYNAAFGSESNQGWFKQ